MSVLLHEAGRLLYGDRWQSSLARDLGVSIRTMQRWAAGAEVPSGLYVDMLRLTQERAAALDKLSVRLVQAAP